MSRIPEISDSKLEKLCKGIKPVVRDDNNQLRYIKDVDPRGTAFTWDPKLKGKAAGLEELDVITTYHTYGYHGFFKPSVAEVISQIPDEYLGQVDAFETCGDLDVSNIQGEYHVTTTTLYTKGYKSDVRVKTPEKTKPFDYKKYVKDEKRFKGLFAP